MLNVCYKAAGKENLINSKLKLCNIKCKIIFTKKNFLKKKN